MKTFMKMLYFTLLSSTLLIHYLLIRQDLDFKKIICFLILLFAIFVNSVILGYGVPYIAKNMFLWFAISNIVLIELGLLSVYFYNNYQIYNLSEFRFQYLLIVFTTLIFTLTSKIKQKYFS